MHRLMHEMFDLTICNIMAALDRHLLKYIILSFDFLRRSVTVLRSMNKTQGEILMYALTREILIFGKELKWIFLDRNKFFVESIHYNTT